VLYQLSYMGICCRSTGFHYLASRPKFVSGI
jgi:hypothetical protein